jgi:hypothetical protein
MNQGIPDRGDECVPTILFPRRHTLCPSVATQGTEETQPVPFVKGFPTERRLTLFLPWRFTFPFLLLTYAEACCALLLPISRMLGEEVNTMAFRSGHIRDYDVFLANDVVTVINEHEQVIIAKQSVRGLSDFANKAKERKLGWRMLRTVR